MTNVKKQKIAFMTDLTVAFQDFVLDSVEQGIDDDFPDHFSFLKHALEMFTELHENMTDEFTK